MGVFEHFPYVNFHELNLSWIINKLKELEDVIGSQIVDIVARAGVAANAQAIQDLSDTVDANAVTAHNESSAAASAASTAQNTADTALSTANTANSTANDARTYQSYSAGDVITLAAAYSSGDVTNVGAKKINGVIEIDMLILTLPLYQGLNVIGTVSSDLRPRFLSARCIASYGSGSELGQLERMELDPDGTLKVYASANLPTSTLRGELTFIGYQ